jgi:hypothetical protein
MADDYARSNHDARRLTPEQIERAAWRSPRHVINAIFRRK